MDISPDFRVDTIGALKSAFSNHLNSYALLSVLALLFVTYVTFGKGFVDSREPPLIPSKVPYVGHLIGMLWNGSAHFESITTTYPIYALQTLTARTYVITSPALVSSAQRARTLSFDPLVPAATRIIFGLDAPTLAILRSAGPSHRTGFLPDIHAEVYRDLERGASLALFSRTMAAAVGAALDESGYGTRGPTYSCVREPDGAIDLYLWIRRVFTHATSRMLYGPAHPLVGSAAHLEDPLWDFCSSVAALLLRPMPRWTARRAYAGREALVDAFTRYFAEGREREASALIRARAAVSRRHGFSTPMLARSELSFLFAAVVNAVPTVFWTLNRLYASPGLLHAVRTQLVAAGVTGDIGAGLDVEAVKSRAPLVLAACRETMRLHSLSSTVRLATQDTLLADRYLIPAGSIVQMAGGVIHRDSAIWGADVAEFNPWRFLHAASGTKTAVGGTHVDVDGGGVEGEVKEEKVHSAAFRAFGGGATLCPGRNLALNEMVGFIAGFVARFDLEIVEENGKEKSEGIPLAERGEKGLPITIANPRKPLYVNVVRRNNTED